MSILAGGWDESYVPDKLILANDLAGTAHQMANSAGLFRSSFAAYLIEVACDITLNVLHNALLRPVSRIFIACNVFRANANPDLCHRRVALLCRRATGHRCRCGPRDLVGG
ncbi:DUF4386 family protein [Granulicella aggregans]|uniref:DUF4386 family protein n=1 Tax=Granulicella aggregans TaxID=474949 RepID=UPI003D7C18A9